MLQILRSATGHCAHQISRRVVCVPHSSADMAATARCSAAEPPPLPTGGFSTRASVMCKMSGCLERHSKQLKCWCQMPEQPRQMCLQQQKSSSLLTILGVVECDSHARVLYHM